MDCHRCGTFWSFLEVISCRKSAVPFLAGSLKPSCSKNGMTSSLGPWKTSRPGAACQMATRQTALFNRSGLWAAPAYQVCQRAIPEQGVPGNGMHTFSKQHDIIRFVVHLPLRLQQAHQHGALHHQATMPLG